MKICILNGDMNPGESGFTNYVAKLEKQLKKYNEVSRFDLDSMDLKFCTGCWTCWWKTPGHCAIKDDGEKILKTVINSDFLIFASPLTAGFTSSALKKITDRFVCLLHPYIKIVAGEFHHRKRYIKYPDFGVIVQKEADTDAEDLRIVKDIYDRFAINFHSISRYFKTNDSINIEELANETCNN